MCKHRQIGLNLYRFNLEGVFVAVLLGLLNQPAHATTIRVPADQPTIQAGVDAVSESDTVLVAPGTYTGPGNYDILLDGKGLVVRSEAGAAATIIDCEGNGRGFRLEGPMATDPVIKGFTIKNGDGGDRGGGVYCFGCTAMIEQCVISNSTADNGGAIYVRGNNISCFTKHCTFVGNSASIRGAVCVGWGAVSLYFENCTAYGNESLAGNSLFWAHYNAAISLSCCDVYGNVPGDWFGYIAAQYGVDDNIRSHPLFCDVEGGAYGLHVASPLLPENSPCGELVGALGIGCNGCYDIDNDGLCAAEDNCPAIANSDQLDTDENGMGDACEDNDGDSHPNAHDNCPDIVNWEQTDKDGDGIGDECDADLDGDGIANEADNCPVNYNPGQEDRNSDGRGDVCCCVDNVGDANDIGGPEPTIGDLSVMIDAKFITGTCLGLIQCLAKADFNQSGGCDPTCKDITIGDISMLIDYLFISVWLQGPPDCLDCP